MTIFLNSVTADAMAGEMRFHVGGECAEGACDETRSAVGMVARPPPDHRTHEALQLASEASVLLPDRDPVENICHFREPEHAGAALPRRFGGQKAHDVCADPESAFLGTDDVEHAGTRVRAI